MGRRIPSLQPAEIGVSSVLITLAATTVVVSVIGRFRKIWLPDYLAVCSLLFACAYSGLVLSFSGTATHEKDHHQLASDASYSKHILAQAFFLDASLLCAKLTILFLYYKLFHIDRATKIAIHLGIVFAFCTYLPRIASLFYYCAPHVGEVWGPPVYQRCPKSIIPSVVESTLAVILDTYLFILPIPVITHLRLTRRKRFNTCMVFAFASFGIIAATISLAFRVRFLEARDHPNGDFTWIGGQTDLATTTEQYIAIIVGRIPPIAGFARQEAHNWASFRTRIWKRITPTPTERSEALDKPDGGELSDSMAGPSGSPSHIRLVDGAYIHFDDLEGGPVVPSNALVKTVTLERISAV